MKYTPEQIRAMAQEFMERLNERDPRCADIIFPMTQRFPGMGPLAVVREIDRLAQP